MIQYGGKQYKGLLNTTGSPGALLTRIGKVWIDIWEKVILELAVERWTRVYQAGNEGWRRGYPWQRKHIYKSRGAFHVNGGTSHGWTTERKDTAACDETETSESDQAFRPKHITSCASSAMTNFSTWRVWISPRKVTQKRPKCWMQALIHRPKCLPRG